MTNALINSILYGALRNEKHRKIRVQGYFRNSIKLGLNLIFKRPVYDESASKVILNFLSPKFINFKCKQWNQDIYAYRVNFDNKLFREIYLIEFLINICFLINLKPLQRFLFRINSKLFDNYLQENNVEGLICGPATILTTFLGYRLKQKGKQVIIFQHGIYQLSSYKVEWYEKEVMTKILVWGEYYKELYLNQGVESSKMEIISPYFSNDIFQYEKVILSLSSIKSILFIGQQLNKVSEHVFEPYNNFISKLIDFYSSLGKDIIYKPHPREKVEDTLTKENFTRLKFYNSKMAPVENFDIFYSVNSTLLVELYLKKKICFQILISIDDLPYDDFSDYTGIPALEINNISQHLPEAHYSFFYDTKYLNIWENYDKQIIHKLESIIHKTKEENFKIG